MRVIARGAPRHPAVLQRESVLWHEGQVINSEAQLAVILGQRVVDKVRVTINVDAQQTPRKRQGAAENPAPFTGPLWLALMRISQMARPFRAVLF